MLKRFAIVFGAVFLVKCIFYILDPSIQLYGGDSFSYLATKRNVWIPPDRSFVYGLLILRSIVRWSHSLGSLVAIQTCTGIAVCLLLYYCSYHVFRFSFSISFALACLFAADPIQLLYERQIMAETWGSLFLAAALTLSLSYIKKPLIWKLLPIPLLGLISTAFRLNSYGPAWFLSFSLPVIFLLKNFVSGHLKPATTETPVLEHYRLAVHLVLGASCFLIMLNQYTHYYGRLIHRRHAVTYSQGLFMLSGLWNVVIPEDAPDPRLSKIIATKTVYFPGANPVLERNSQFYGPDGIISRWQKIPLTGPDNLHDDIAKRTVLNAILRAPFQVLHETLSNCWECLFNMKSRVLEIFDKETPITEQQCQLAREDYGLALTQNWKANSTLTKTLLSKCSAWFYVLLLSPVWGLAFAVLVWRTDYFIPFLVIIVVGILDLLPSCMFVVTNARLLHPLDFGVFLMLGAMVNYVIQRTFQRKLPGAAILKAS